MVPTGWGSSAHCPKLSKSTEINVPQTFAVSLREMWDDQCDHYIWEYETMSVNYLKQKVLRNCPDTLDKRTKRSDYWRRLAIFATEPFTSSTECWCCRPPYWWYCLLIKVNLKWNQPMNSNIKSKFLYIFLFSYYSLLLDTE